jgi:hypothetical protein
MRNPQQQRQKNTINLPSLATLLGSCGRSISLASPATEPFTLKQLAPLVAYTKVMLHVHWWNIDKNRRLAKVLGIEEPRELEWYLHKALQQYFSSYGKMKYPPDLSLSDEFDVEHGWEPIGHHYSRYNRWQQIDNAVQMLSQVNTNPSHSGQTDDAPSKDTGASGGSSSLPATPETPNIAPTTRAPTTPDTPNTAHSPAPQVQ